jgi:hypothetical protein
LVQKLGPVTRTGDFERSGDRRSPLGVRFLQRFAMAQYSRLMPQEDVAANEVFAVISQNPGVTVGELLDRKLSAALPAIELLLEEELIRVEVERKDGSLVKRFYSVPRVLGMG